MCVWVVLHVCFDCIVEEACDGTDYIRGEIEENKRVTHRHLKENMFCLR